MHYHGNCKIIKTELRVTRRTGRGLFALRGDS